MKFLLFVFVLFPASSWAAESSHGAGVCFRKGMEGEEKNQCLKYFTDKANADRKLQRELQMEPQPNCFENLGKSFTGGLGRSYEHDKEKSRELLDASQSRMEVLKDCRQELRETWVSFQAKKAERQKQQNLYPVKLREAELGYQREINRINRECRGKANADFLKYREMIQAKGAISPDQLHGFGNRVNSHRHRFFKACYQASDNVRAMQVAETQLAINMDKAKAEMRSVDDMVKSFSDQTGVIQDDILKDCEDRRKLNAYNEALAKRNTSKADFNNRMQTMVEFGLSAGSCMDDFKALGGDGIDMVNPIESAR